MTKNYIYESPDKGKTIYVTNIESGEKLLIKSQDVKTEFLKELKILIKKYKL